MEHGVKTNTYQNKIVTNKGITLVALIITIIVMLILSGVVLNLTLGERGIFKTAQLAGKNYTNASQKEEYQLGGVSNEVKNIMAENGLLKPPKKEVLEFPVLTSQGIKNIKCDDNGEITYELDLTAEECSGIGAAPKTLYDGDRDTYINYGNSNWGRNGVFLVDSSAIGTEWQISYTGGTGYIIAYRDFRSDGLNVDYGDLSRYIISKGFADSITITSDMKYVSFWSGSGNLVASEVYRIK